MQIFVKTQSGKKIKLMIESSSDEIDNVKATVNDINITVDADPKEAVDDLPGTMQIYVKSPKDKMMVLFVKKSDTVLSVKKMIQAKAGHLPNCQTLSFKGKQLKDRDTLEDYNILKESTLSLLAVP